MRTVNYTEQVFEKVLANALLLVARQKGKLGKRMKYTEAEFLVLALVNKYPGIIATNIATFLGKTLNDVLVILLKLGADELFEQKEMGGTELHLNARGQEAYSHILRDLIHRQSDLLVEEMKGRQFPQSAATLEIILSAQDEVLRDLPKNL